MQFHHRWLTLFQFLLGFSLYAKNPNCSIPDELSMERTYYVYEGLNITTICLEEEIKINAYEGHEL